MADAPGPARRTGFGRVLIFLYGLMAVASCSRSAVQISTQFGQAPIAYGLSAFAAVVYVLATIGLARRGEVARRLALVACSTELAGVLAVGTFTVVVPSDFPDATVWSGFGQGYVFIPLVLPLLGLWWLRRTGAGPDHDLSATRPPSP